MIENLLDGLAGASEPHNLLVLTIGVAIGIGAGALPGLNAGVLLALMLPATFTMDADSGIILLTATYVGAEYGGSITAILINTPGTAGAVVTVIDGYALTRRGEPRKALLSSLIPGAIGGIIGNIILIGAAVPLADFALQFGPAEFFALGVLGVTLIASLTGKNVVKGFLSAVLGLFAATIGLDALTGFARFTFGMADLRDGIDIVPAMTGLLALSEALILIDERHGVSARITRSVSRAYPTLAEWKRMGPATVRGSLIGTGAGTIPGAGAIVASLLAYNEERRVSKHPEEFGHGAIEGIAAPEAANNAQIGGSLIPSLTLGIPPSVSAAILVGALSIHGLQPGPALLSGPDADIVYSVFVSQFFANIVMVGLGLVGMMWWIRVVEIDKMVLACAIIVLVFVGAYASQGSVFDMVIALVLGVAGYTMRKIGMPLAPFILAMVLAELLESNFRRLLLLSGGDYLFIFSQPIADVVLAMAALSLWVAWRRRSGARSDF